MKTPMWTFRLIGYVALFFIVTALVGMAIPWLITLAIFCGLFELGWLLYRRNKE
jgi:hypothetical protein